MNDLLLSELSSSRIDLMHTVSLLEQEFFATTASKIDANLSAVNELITYCQKNTEDITDALDRAERLMELLFVDKLFTELPCLHASIKCHQLDHVLTYRTFSPALKNLLLIHIIRSCGFDVAAVYVPNHVMLRIVCDDDYAIIFNSLDGNPLNWLELDQRINDLDSSNEQATLEAIDDNQLIVQYLISLKNALIREQEFTLALQCVDIILALNPNDPYHRRDRGFLLQQLDCYKVAFDDYRYFVEKCPQDPQAKILQMQLDMISQVTIKLH